MGNVRSCFNAKGKENMKKIIIVEDKPWVTENAVCNLQKKNIDVVKMVYYPNSFGNEKEKKRLMDAFKEKTKVEVDEVYTQEEFVNKMEELYELENVVFFMDYELKGDFTEEANKRINVRYARYKEYGEGFNSNERKIWFYTASSVGNVAVLYHNFPDNVLLVTKYSEGRLEWEEEKIDQILG